ncbi:MAG TPA: hypothetical protein PKH10_09075 [bacterium]|nr:hypothetical protein [bacterium]
MKWLVIIFAFLFITACDGTKKIATDQESPMDTDTPTNTDTSQDGDIGIEEEPASDDMSPPDDDMSAMENESTMDDDTLDNESVTDSDGLICRIDDERCGEYDQAVEICTAQGWQIKQNCDALEDCYQYIEDDVYVAACHDMSEPDDKDECHVNDTMCSGSEMFEDSRVIICTEGTDWYTLEYCEGDIYDGCREEFASGAYYAECVFKGCSGHEGELACGNNSLYICEEGYWVFKEDCGPSKECHGSIGMAECGEIWQDDVKPNIYLYPTAPLDITVQIGFPQGGRVTVSEPLYSDGWDVHVTPDGLIDDQWRFLFYESVQPNGWQKERGYLVATDEMERFFRNDLATRGFVGQEIEDFIEWWMPLLAGTGYLIVYPQDDAVIRTVETLELSVAPDNLLRHRYVIETTSEPITIEPPADPAPFIRDGFTVTEWGVIRLQP